MMLRLPEDRILSNLLEKGEATGMMMKRIAGKISHFHLSAPSSEEITRIGGTSAVDINTEEDFAQIKPFISQTLSKQTFDLLAEYTRTFRSVNAGLFDERETGGWIRDGHGDLHSQHICMDNGIQIFDCIEFNKRFRYSDILCDAAFLSMDIEKLGHLQLASTYTEAYLKEAGQEGNEALYNFYKCYRAVVRGKVEGYRFKDPSVSGSEAAQARDNAADFMLLAEKFARTLSPLTYFLTCGLIGSGKSSVANGLASKLDLTVFSSDRVRKELVGIDPEESREVPFESGIYSPDMTEKTYRKINDEALKTLGAGGSVVADATFSQRAHREAAAKTAAEAGARLLVLHLTASENTLKERLAVRRKKGGISDGRVEVLADHMNSFVRPVELGESSKVELDDSSTLDESIKAAYRCALRTI